MKAILDLAFKDFQQKDQTLQAYNAQLFLIVNVASQCGLTPQYAALEKLYQQYKDRGLIVLAFPSNDFLAQEPASNEEIQLFCQTHYNVTFPVLSKITVKGKAQHPLYKYLIDNMPIAKPCSDNSFLDMLKAKGLLSGEERDIKWNFEKFLISKQGTAINRYLPNITPNDNSLIEDIESYLQKLN